MTGGALVRRRGSISSITMLTRSSASVVTSASPSVVMGLWYATRFISVTSVVPSGTHTCSGVSVSSSLAPAGVVYCSLSSKTLPKIGSSWIRLRPKVRLIRRSPSIAVPAGMRSLSPPSTTSPDTDPPITVATVSSSVSSVPSGSGLKTTALAGSGV